MRTKKHIMVELKRNLKDGKISLYALKRCIRNTTMMSVYRAVIMRGIHPEVNDYRGRECLYVDINDAERIINYIKGIVK